MPGSLPPPSTFDPRWKKTIFLELFVFDKAEQPPKTKLSETLASSARQEPESLALYGRLALAAPCPIAGPAMYPVQRHGEFVV
ncbi:hypothetical protein VM1G_11305 [Cytospora mali]|uniref:Uncharacterized protein n=1 Tax=Cytospora mali TaxID=578113 RepID=A0A194VLL4_CYTMA|nr:hypothetical protein VM1G_11305 [Valsa mali]